MDWDKLRIFHKVAEAGSLTHAGDDLNLSQSAVSRQIKALEESLDVTLFHRHARGLLLTEQGELLFNAASAMSKDLDAAAARIRDSKDNVVGELRVTTTTGFGTLWLTRRLPRLLGEYPDLKIDLILAENVLDLPMREADVAIRMKEPSQADLVRRRLMEVRMQLFAMPEYLEANGTPESIADLGGHRLLMQAVDSPQPSAAAFCLIICKRKCPISFGCFPMRKAPRFRSSWLTQKSLDTQNEWRHSGILCSKRYRSIGAFVAKKPNHRPIQTTI